MTQSSFRWRGEPPPHQYRTPSPPVNFYEPLTPTAPNQEGVKALPRPAPHELAKPKYPPGVSYYHRREDGASRERDGGAQAGLDTFASIALAANGRPRPKHRSATFSEHSSSTGFLSNFQQYDTRQHDGSVERQSRLNEANNDHFKQSEIDYSLETRRKEAELLLNFSREACYAIPKASPTFQRPLTSQTEGYNLYGSPQAIFSTPPQVQHVFNRSQGGESHVPHSPNNQFHRKHSFGSHFATANFSQHATRPSSHSHLSPQLGGNSLRERVSETARSASSGLGLQGLDNWQTQGPNPSRVVQDTEGVPENEKQVNSQTYRVNQEMAPTAGIGDHLSVSGPLNPIINGLSPGFDKTADMDTIQQDVISTPKPIAIKDIETPQLKQKQVDSPSICASCNFSRNLFTGDNEANSTSWISCDGCRKWFHFACAGFRSEREVRGVDKYRCKACKPIHGPTTYVRKSARAHSAIDYAGLNEGVIKTSDEDPEHHYVKDFKNGKKFTPETFARMRPELVSADFFRRGDGMKEPILIPAMFNPRPRQIPKVELNADAADLEETLASNETLHDRSLFDSWLPGQFEIEVVEDEGQDALDMVIPQDLTVRKVSELYGPEEKIEVIDVKSQNGEDKRWTMKRWVEYYESTGDKVVRNVISLEVSQSKLGRLIRRPRIVRDLDLQDAVWPADLIAKGEYPKVQFYCLMSVADCYTDFHIDFGGSSVYYHILKGKKTFFFIPPHEKHLKKYEEWCNSPAQNWTFLGDQTKECYRVDLSEGDTMLIPAGWIHAVWTPEDSLVIGGNFLTPMHYPLQIRVAQIEKATNVARKFRYPNFQKLLWYAALHYMDEDPMPDSVAEVLKSGQVFYRAPFSIEEYEAWGDDSPSGPENFQAQYYGRAELDGLPELCRYLLRTALIATGNLTDGISTETRNAVKRSIPKGHNHGEPLEAVKKFALWCTWKRGNETIPYWAYPTYIPEGGAADQTEKKLSVKARRKLDREAAYQAFKVAPDRQSTRARTQPQNLLAEIVANQNAAQSSKKTTPTPTPESAPSFKRKLDDSTSNGKTSEQGSPPAKKPRTSSGSKTGSARRPACEACRKSRRACKHRDDPLPAPGTSDTASGSITVNSTPVKAQLENGEVSSPGSDKIMSMLHVEIVKSDMRPISQNDVTPNVPIATVQLNGNNNITPSKTHGRTKACKDCRKSKRRCIHDEFGNEDPIKMAEAAIPRPAAKRKRLSNAKEQSPQQKKQSKSSAGRDDQSAAPEKSENPLPHQGQVATESEVLSLDHSAAQQPHPEENGILPIPVDPELLVQSSTAAPQSQPPIFSPEDEVNLIATSPLSDVKCESPTDDLHVVPAVASSLVSPPDSTHADAERTPPATVKLNGFTPPTTSASSRQSSHPAKQQGSRYTPESGPVRRPSSSSGDAFTRESMSPTVSAEPSAVSRRRKSRTSSAIDADVESLKLIREIQAQDLGLRRRGRV